MSVNTFDPGASQKALITMTDAAKQHFQKAVAAKPGSMLRLATETNGCSGYGYLLELVDGAKQDDQVLTMSDELQLAVAADAVAVLRGTEIDMVKEGINKVVKFNNPNVTGECGCGESFSI